MTMVKLCLFIWTFLAGSFVFASSFENQNFENVSSSFELKIDTNSIIPLYPVFNSNEDLFTPIPEKTNQPTKHILLVASYHMTQLWTNKIYTELKSMTYNSPYFVDFTVIDYDTTHPQGRFFWENNFKEHIPHIKNLNYDMIITLDDDAVNLVLKYHQWIPASVPIVFAGYENYHPQDLKLHPNMTGVSQTTEIFDTAKLGLKIYPKAQQILILSDASESGLFFQQQMKEKTSEINGVKVLYWNDATCSKNELFKKIKALPGDTILILVLWKGLYPQEFQSLTTFAIELSNFVEKPFFLKTNTLFGYGGVGGYLTIAEDHAKQLGNIVFKVFDNNNVASGIPVQKGEERPVFDYQKMIENRLDITKLPSNTLLLNKPPSLWETHSQTVIISLIIFSLLIIIFVLIIGLLISYKRATHNKLEILKNLPVQMGIIDNQENILFLKTMHSVNLVKSKAQKLSDIQEMNYSEISSICKRVFQEKKSITISHSYRDNQQVICFAPLPFSMYHKPTLIWIAHDNSELQEIRTKLANLNLILQNILENIPCYLYVQERDKQNNFLFVSSLLEKELGVAHNEMIGKTVQEVFPKSADQHFDFLTHSPSEQTQNQIQQGKFIKNGVSKDIFYNNKILQDNNLNLNIGIGIDLTELVESKQQIENSNKLWTTVMNTVPILFFVKNADDDFRYLLLNDNFAYFVNRKPEEIIGKNDNELFQNQIEVDHFKKFDIQTMDLPNGQTFVEHVKGGGHLRVLRTTKQSFKTVDGQNMLLGTSIDISNEHYLLENGTVINNALKMMTLESDFQTNLGNIAFNLQSIIPCDRILVKGLNEKTQQYKNYYFWQKEKMNQANSSIIENDPLYWDTFEKILQQNNDIVISDWSQQQIVALPSPQSIQSLMMTPIFVDNVFWGVISISFFTVFQNFSEFDQRLMRAVSNIITLAFIRYRQMIEIQKNNNEIQMILNNIKIPIWLYDSNFQLMRINSAVCQMANLSESEILAHPCSDFFCFNQKASCPVQKTIESKQSSHAVFHFKNRDYTVYAEPVLDANQKLVNIVKSAVDITDLNHYISNERILNNCMISLLHHENPNDVAMSILKAINNHLKASRTLMLRCDDKMQQISLVHEFCPPENYPILDLTESYSINWSSQNIVQLQNQEVCQLNKLPKSELFISIQNFFTKFPEIVIQSFCTIGILFYGQIWGVLCISFEKNSRLLDIQEQQFLRNSALLLELMLERSHSHQQIVNALDKAQAANKAKSFFLASMSHEIRTPLNAVIGFAELLCDETLDKESQHEFINNIYTSGNALLDLINDILDLSKLESDQMVFTPVQTDFVALCKEVVSIFQQKVNQKSLEMELQCPKTLMIKIDKLRIRQILFNLIGNAVKFTTHGKITLKVEFIPESEHLGTLILAVQDTGCGIPLCDQEHLFDPFVQSKSIRGTNVAQQGTGLGLAIVQRMLKKINGQIVLESEQDRGSTFTVTIQKVSYGEEMEEVLIDNNFPKLDPLSLHCRRVLIIDDIDMNLNILSAMLQQLGLQVITVDSGLDALLYIKKNPIDLVITDLWMPKINGEELAQQIHLIFPALPVIAVTADIESKETFDHSLFYKVLTKPIHINQLEQVLNQLDN